MISVLSLHLQLQTLLLRRTLGVGGGMGRAGYRLPSPEGKKKRSSQDLYIAVCDTAGSKNLKGLKSIHTPIQGPAVVMACFKNLRKHVTENGK